MEEQLSKMMEQIVASIPNVLTALAIVIVSIYVARLLANLLRRALERRNAAAGLTNLLAQIVRWTIVTMGMITALQRFFDVTAFLAGLGILGFAVGFALQDIMQNFVAGIILLLQQPFNAGDIVNVASFEGTILFVELRTTEIRTLDGRIVILPNASILSNPIINYTRAERRRVELEVGVAYGSDPEKVRGLVLEAVRGVTGFVAEPAPMVAFHTFNNSSLDLTAYFWIDMKLTNPLISKDAAFMKVNDAFAKAGVEIPFPITTVLLHSEK